MYRSPQLMKKENVIDFKFVHKLLHKSCCCLGVMVSAAGIYTYFIIMAENGFMPQDLMGIRKAWYSRAVNDLKDSYNQEWTYSDRIELEYCSQTGFFVTVVVVQMFTLMGHKTSRESLWAHGLRFMWWLPGIPFGVFLFAYDEVRNFIIRHSADESWFAKETY
ncbi:hypothetical protein TNIN_340051 [Trichonephila inaurata madagascariensis]|uniref:Cation-transporting P-type ATPase C-terminal domain-containing protein n=1 Tax=Trichonephila inaurata madagascariensis TaxID=2747483 RepID=A0A8X6WTU3_9ARAC|nr:hypothetical protein TNIN_340051 [Trichonephila inaurata madagascariensis]